MSEEGLRRLVLTGFMGSGKTTVGRTLAAELGWRFADLDEAVEALLGVSVPRILAEQGEAAFRAGEVKAMRELVASSRIVIALGGGAPETPDLRNLLAGASETAVVYLEAPFGPLFARCVHQARDPGAVERPFLGSEEQARDRFDRRRELYEAIATCIVPAHPGTPAEVAKAIRATFGRQLISG